MTAFNRRAPKRRLNRQERRCNAAFAAPHQKGAQVRLGVDTGLATTTGQVGGDRPQQRIGGSFDENGEQDGLETGHTRCCGLTRRHPRGTNDRDGSGNCAC